MNDTLPAKDATFKVKTPASTDTKVFVPFFGDNNNEVTVKGKVREGKREGNYIVFDDLVSGTYVFERKIQIIRLTVYGLSIAFS
ncbi:MAG: hypothetical protein WBG71_08695 [Leeuwenhoekiella sp.]